MLCLLGKLSHYFHSSQWLVLGHTYFLCHQRTAVWQSTPRWSTYPETACTHAAYTPICLHSRKRSHTHTFTHTLTHSLFCTGMPVRCADLSEFQGWYRTCFWNLKLVRLGWWQVTPKGMSGQRGTVRSKRWAQRGGGKLPEVSFILCPFAV